MSEMNTFRTRLATLASAAALMIAATSGAAAQAEMPADLVAAAKAEGSLTVYTNVDPSLMEKLSAAFTAAHGIKVDIQRQASSALAQRFVAENDTDNTIADVYYSTDRAFHDDLFAKGLFSSVETVPGYAEWPQEAKSEGTITIGYNPYSLVWNKDLVPNGLTSWEQLNDPAYEGQVILTDPRSSVTSNQFYKMLHDLYGDAFLEKLGSHATYSPSAVPGIQQVAAGAQAIYAPGIHQVVTGLVASGAPLGESFPEPSISSNNVASLVAKAPHANAAKLFVAFLMTKEAQAINNFDGFSPIEGIENTRTMPQIVNIEPTDAMAASEKIYQLMGLQ
ncbi:ABC transporter substrate-binding protein [Chelativorans sp. J32]|uniref:ABC transporter substrate-binding protein n=1 Tax=Chelativorans sp. J32 TaxID=935840 RepID=UPI0004B21735|nr:extracellular solute-binding protein [Chelativorans sp. J32]